MAKITKGKQLVILLMRLLFVTHFCFAVKPGKISKHPVLIIISYDGLRYDFFNKKTPNMDQVKAEGVTIPFLQNQFATFTFPNHHSIVTGLYEEAHGIIGNRFYDPLYGKKLEGFKDEAGFWNYSSSILPLYTLNEVAGDGRHSGVMMWPGSSEPWGINNTLSTYRVRFNQSISMKWRIDTVFDWITDPIKPANLVFLYYEQPDATAHNHGIDGPEMIDMIEKVDNDTGYILKKLEDLGLKDNVSLIFLSDHGMNNVEPNHFATFKHIISNENDETFIAYGEGSPILQLQLKNIDDAEKIFQTFQAVEKQNHFTAYLKSKVDDVKPNWHYSKNRRIMPVYLVADLGYVFEGVSPKNFTYAVHGWDNHHVNMRAHFMALGPLFKKKQVLPSFQNIDIYPLVCHIMNIVAPPNNGSLERSLPVVDAEALVKAQTAQLNAVEL